MTQRMQHKLQQIAQFRPGVIAWVTNAKYMPTVWKKVQNLTLHIIGICRTMDLFCPS